MTTDSHPHPHRERCRACREPLRPEPDRTAGCRTTGCPLRRLLFSPLPTPQLT
jgi:hypothetical protein